MSLVHAWPVLLLVACGVPEPAPAPPPAPAPAAPAPPVDPYPWRLDVTGTGAALVRLVGAEERLRLACRRDPPSLLVVAERFAPIPSEERLSLGVGDEVVALVADPGAKRPAGVEATGPIPVDLLARLASGGAVGITYGAQTLTIPGPDPATAARFAEACRAVAAAP